MDWQNSVRFWLLAIVATLLLAYSNSFHGPFIFDDLTSIPENKLLHNLSQSLFQSPQSGETVASRPLAHFSFAINYAWTGLNVRSYHLLNLVIHGEPHSCSLDFLKKHFPSLVF